MAAPLRQILLVEDDERYGRAVIRAAARRGALSVHWVRSVAEAKAVLQRWPRSRWHSALVDDRLPDGFGLELLPLLRSFRPKPAVAFVTAFARDERAMEAFRWQQSLLPKPVTPAGLHRLLAILEEQNGGARKPVLHEETAMPPAANAAEPNPFVLDAAGLETPSGFVRLRPSEVRLLRLLVARAGEVTATSAIARDLFRRADRAAPLLVRKHVANVRRRLGNYAWILESSPRHGYRVPAMIADCSASAHGGASAAARR